MTYEYDLQDYEILQDLFAALDFDSFQWPMTAGELYSFALLTNETLDD